MWGGGCGGGGGAGGVGGEGAGGGASFSLSVYLSRRLCLCNPTHDKACKNDRDKCTYHDYLALRPRSVSSHIRKLGCK